MARYLTALFIIIYALPTGLLALCWHTCRRKEEKRVTRAIRAGAFAGILAAAGTAVLVLGMRLFYLGDMNESLGGNPYWKEIPLLGGALMLWGTTIVVFLFAAFGAFAQRASLTVPALIFIAGMGVLLAAMEYPGGGGQHPVGKVRKLTCALCRATRTDIHFLWRDSTWVEENSCSRWYAEHVEPRHAHQWLPPHSWTGLDIFGCACVASSGNRNPLWLIHPDDQLSIYKHFQDPSAARDLFSRMGIEDRPDYKEAERTYRNLLSWEAAGFPDSWEKWADEHRNMPLP